MIPLSLVIDFLAKITVIGKMNAKRCLGIGKICSLEITMLFVKDVIALAIQVMVVERRTCSHVVAGITAMLNMKIGIEHMGVKEMNGTIAEMPLHDQDIHRFR